MVKIMFVGVGMSSVVSANGASQPGNQHVLKIYNTLVTKRLFRPHRKKN